MSEWRCGVRLAVIADIHGNIQALEAICRDIKSFAPDLIVVGGDMIGGGPDAVAVLDLLSTLDHIAVRGNHEELTLRVSAGRLDATSLDARIAAAEAELLGERWLKHIALLPDHRTLSLQTHGDVCIAHGIPGDTRRTILHDGKEHEVADSPFLRERFLTAEELRTLLARVKSDLFITAHSHSQFCRPIFGTTVVNPGCVKGEFSWNSDQVLAEYAILDLYRPQVGGHVWYPTLRPDLLTCLP